MVLEKNLEKTFALNNFWHNIFLFVPFGILSLKIMMFHFSLGRVPALVLLSKTGCDWWMQVFHCCNFCSSCCWYCTCWWSCCSSSSLRDSCCSWVWCCFFLCHWCSWFTYCCYISSCCVNSCCCSVKSSWWYWSSCWCYSFSSSRSSKGVNRAFTFDQPVVIFFYYQHEGVDCLFFLLTNSVLKIEILSWRVCKIESLIFCVCYCLLDFFPLLIFG